MRAHVDRSTPHANPDYEVSPGAWWEGSPADGGSHNVFTNGMPTMRQGDTYASHIGYKHVQDWWPDGTPYARKVDDQHQPPVASEGEPSVLVNGIPIHLDGQDIDCPNEGTGSSHAFGGSPDVKAGI